MRINILIIIFVIMLISSCMVKPIQLLPSTIPITSNTSYTILGKAEGNACRYSFFIPPITFGSGGLQSSMEKALASQDADGIIGVSVDEFTSFFLIGFSSCTYTYGTAIKVLNK